MMANQLNRRGFLFGAGLGVVAGGSLAWLGKGWAERWGLLQQDRRSFTGTSVEIKNPEFAMPGPFPGRVVEVHHPDSVRGSHTVNSAAVGQMMARGMQNLTGADNPLDAWRRFFSPGDIVGIKVNPVGQKGSDKIGAISSPAIVLEVVDWLKQVGVKGRDIVVFERYATEFRKAGYEDVMRERVMDDVRWYASSSDGGNVQLDIEGYDGRRDRDPHVVGYDPDTFVHMGFAAPEHDPADDRRFRSHLSSIITKLVDKVITIPVLKDHRSAGVTLALKNMSHGFNNNVARSHLSGIVRLDGSVSGPNQCNTFIPTAASQNPTRQKATLHILDGLVGVYEGGPGTWNATWATWPYKSLFFATDPVALDHVGWDIIDAKRVQEGWPPAARMGLMEITPGVKLSTRLAAFTARDFAGTAAYNLSAARLEAGRATESFDRRQPEHIILSGLVGLGIFDANRIDHRKITLKV
jgi:uncharacterized protein (DUF362 family)